MRARGRSPLRGCASTGSSSTRCPGQTGGLPSWSPGRRSRPATTPWWPSAGTACSGSSCRRWPAPGRRWDWSPPAVATTSPGCSASRRTSRRRPPTWWPAGWCARWTPPGPADAGTPGCSPAASTPTSTSGPTRCAGPRVAAATTWPSWPSCACSSRCRSRWSWTASSTPPRRCSWRSATGPRTAAGCGSARGHGSTTGCSRSRCSVGSASRSSCASSRRSTRAPMSSTRR